MHNPKKAGLPERMPCYPKKPIENYHLYIGLRYSTGIISNKPQIKNFY